MELLACSLITLWNSSQLECSLEARLAGMLSKTKAVPAATRDRCKCECLLVSLCMRVPGYDSVNSLVAVV